MKPAPRSMRKLPILQANAGLRLRISGHADERGSDEYNIALGQRRAVAVKRYLMDQGIDGGRLDDIVSFGEEQPAVQRMVPRRPSRRTAAPSSRSRRAVTTLVAPR